jgi:hypothetical protein
MNYKKIFVDTAKTTASQKAYDKVSLYHALRKNMAMPANRAYSIAKEC